jgi:hypothetical protein
VAAPLLLVNLVPEMGHSSRDRLLDLKADAFRVDFTGEAGAVEWSMPMPSVAIYPSSDIDTFTTTF